MMKFQNTGKKREDQPNKKLENVKRQMKKEQCEQKTKSIKRKNLS